MATPQIFLSHSGEQKDFTRRLYHELVLVNHNPFFDQDSLHSLPKGEPYPPRLVTACQSCKLGVVVLSHKYIESLWPMLELHQLFFHNPSAPNNVYPIFYKLTPGDLSNEDNLKRWQDVWARKESYWHAKLKDMETAASGPCTSHFQLSVDVKAWRDALLKLRYQNGDVPRFTNNDEHAFIQDIVSNICKRFPPPITFLMDDEFKGAQTMQQKIDGLFQQQQRNVEIDRIPIAVGVYGVGGSGKTTMCKYMINFYNKAYPGSCYFLQFPSKEEDEKLLVQSIEDILSKRGAKQTEDRIKSFEEAVSYLQKLLKRYKVFLVLDNVWDWAFQRAKHIVTMDYVPGSKLLVTARSESLLQILSRSIRNQVDEADVGRLPAMQIVHVPSISEEEAVEALMAYGVTPQATYAKDLRGLARSCFYDGQCHPLLLNAVGSKLRYRGAHIHGAREWTQLISDLQADIRAHCDEEIEDKVMKVLKSSFDVLHFSRAGVSRPYTSK